jgi:alpha-beta hydrolase superfamily lysophospholipase
LDDDWDQVLAHWPERAIFPARSLSPDEAALEPGVQTFFVDDDSYPLMALYWGPTWENSSEQGVVLVLHGVQSHAGWYHGLGRRLAAAGYAAVFPDRRGSGANRLARGHAPSARRLVEDVGQIADKLKASVPSRPLVLAGISWGGKLVVSAAAQFPDRIDAIALVGPGLTPRVGVSRRERLGIAAAVLTGRAARVTFPIPLADPALFTANPQARELIANDPLSLRHGTAGLLASSFFLDRMVRRAVRRVRQPALLMLAGQDRIVDNERTRATFERLASPAKRIIDYPEAHHTLEFEPDPSRYARDLIGWLDETLGRR